MTNPNSQLLKRSSTTFLQAVIVLIGVGALAILLIEPRCEGRNAHATAFQVYFNDPFLAYVYLASIPFFVALYQGFRVVGYAGQNQVFSPAAVRALRMIKLCAIAMIVFVAGAEVYILMPSDEDRAGGVVVGLVIGFGSIVMAAVAATLQRVVQNAADLKSELELTV